MIIILQNGIPKVSTKDKVEIFSKKIPRNFINLGNTCFINATMQILFRTEAFRRSLGTMSNPGSLRYVLQQCYENLFQPVRSSFAPTELVDYAKHHLDCREKQQEDPAYFLGHLLEKWTVEEGQSPMQLRFSKEIHDPDCHQLNKTIFENTILINVMWADSVQEALPIALIEAVMLSRCCRNESRPVFTVVPEVVTVTIDYLVASDSGRHNTMAKKRIIIDPVITVPTEQGDIPLHATGIIFHQSSRYRSAHYISYSRVNRSTWFQFDDLSDVKPSLGYPTDKCPFMPTVVIYESKIQWKA